MPCWGRLSLRTRRWLCRPSFVVPFAFRWSSCRDGSEPPRWPFESEVRFSPADHRKSVTKFNSFNRIPMITPIVKLLVVKGEGIHQVRVSDRDLYCCASSFQRPCWWRNQDSSKDCAAFSPSRWELCQRAAPLRNFNSIKINYQNVKLMCWCAQYLVERWGHEEFH